MLGLVAVSLVACAGLDSELAESAGQDPPRLDSNRSQYMLLQPVRTARLTPFRTADGEAIDLSRFKGKVVLLNFWATWCAPCVFEMPSLNRLAAEMSGDEFAVVPIAIDEKGLTTAASFYRSHNLDALDLYLDPEQQTAYGTTDNPKNAEFALIGLPVSYIVDHEGRVMGYIAGAVDWQSNAAKALIRYYTGRIGR
jgi:thiol-disulfide isomerase/thioredoxin